ncbi:MAG: hypothetical protein HFJ28_03275 [Clostridia bacterium]|jgi:hypothetical protein|nr:hypothetical protein [Clostridia bacterium]
MKLDKDFKKNIDREFQEGDYVGKKLLSRGVLVVVLLVVIFGAIGFGYKRIAVDANREIFKHSTTYTETAASFLAKEYREYNQAETDVEKTAIMEYVVDRYPNLDLEDIDNSDLKSFYRQCLRGGN